MKTTLPTNFFCSDRGGGGEPIINNVGDIDARRKGPFVALGPTGVKVSSLTHHPNPINGIRANPHKKKMQQVVTQEEFLFLKKNFPKNNCQ